MNSDSSYWWCADELLRRQFEHIQRWNREMVNSRPMPKAPEFRYCETCNDTWRVIGTENNCRVLSCGHHG